MENINELTILLHEVGFWYYSCLMKKRTPIHLAAFIRREVERITIILIT